MQKLKQSTISFSKCLFISANFLLFGLFCYLFVNQSQISYDQQLFNSNGLFSKSGPSLSETSSSSPTSSTPSTRSPTGESPSSIPTENAPNNSSSEPSSTPEGSSNSPTSSTPTPSTGSPTSQSSGPSSTPTENSPNNPSPQNNVPVPESSGNTPKEPPTSSSYHSFIIEDPQEYPFAGRTIPLTDEANKFVGVPSVSSRQRILCGVLKNRNCHSYFIAGNADLVWVIAPIYIFSTYGEQYYDYLILHENFKSYIKSFGLNHITIEAIRFPNETTNPSSLEPTTYSKTIPNNEPYDIQVYYYNLTYIRENLLNVAIRKLDKLLPWDYVMWIDAHHFFENPYWWEDGIYKIERSGAVQLFDTFDWLGYGNISYLHINSVIRMSLFTNTIEKGQITYGNAYILTKDLYNQIGYIYDECIATCCDCAYVLASFPDEVGLPLPDAVNYYKTFDPWINHTKAVFKSRRTYVRGFIKHFFHAKNFPYMDLQNMIDFTDFDPKKDIGRDSNFSIYIKNEYISKRMEEIILEFKNTP